MSWEPIEGFRSPGEYARFQRWIADRLEAGAAERVPVDPDWKDANPLLEEWYRDVETGEVWSLVLPDPPSHGFFSPLGRRD